MMRRLHNALLAVLIAFGATPGHGLTQGSVAGVVCDSAGIPQIGAVVQLLRPDLSVLATVYTNTSGHFEFAAIAPGQYSVKAMGASYLPSLREHVRVRSKTVLNLTLNTLYEVMQWLPAEPRARNAQSDDWKWTLRSAANRPLLRWLEDGPLVVASDGTGTHPRLKARLMATGQVGSFGESGERITSSVEVTPANSRMLLARVDFAPNSKEGMDSMLGFRQDLGYAGAVQSMVAVTLRPNQIGGARQGIEQGMMRSSERIQLGDRMEIEAGSALVAARFSASGARTVSAVLPFADVALRSGRSVLRYRYATALPGARDQEEMQTPAGQPRLGLKAGQLLLERGTHQQISWERRAGATDLAVALFADQLENAILEATGPAAGAEGLLDPVSGQARVAEAGYGSAGLMASVGYQFSNGNQVRLSYANGNALAMSALATQVRQTAAQSARPRRAQMCALALSGTIEGTGTHWRASYRWQPTDTMTRVAAYAQEGNEPYLNLHLRQPLTGRLSSGSRVEALLDLRNLLAEGYRPVLTRDGSVLVFAQGMRGISAGVAFTF